MMKYLETVVPHPGPLNEALALYASFRGCYKEEYKPPRLHFPQIVEIFTILELVKF